MLCMSEEQSTLREVTKFCNQISNNLIWSPCFSALSKTCFLFMSNVRQRKSARLKGSSLCVKQGAELCQETQESVFKNASGVPGRNTLSAVKTAVLSVLLQFVWCRLPETKVNYIKSLFISNKKDVNKLIIFINMSFSW